MTKIRKKIGNIPINEIEQQVQQSVTTAVGKMQQDTSTAINQMKQDVSDFIDEETAQYPEIGGAFRFQKDVENRSEITLDASNKVISYRKQDGTKVENVGIETNKLTLTYDGMTEFKQALKDSGFQPGGEGDWSDYISNDGKNPLCIPEPICAKLNIITDTDLRRLTKKGKSGAIEGETYDVPVYFEFYDNSGNYFKKPAIISGQGRTSLHFPKRNISFDLFDNEHDGDAFSIKFGDWVSQDSFHLKGYWSDAFRGMDIAAYKMYQDMVKTYGIDKDRPYKYLFADKFSYDYKGGDGNVDESFVCPAICTPMGFPVIVYENGEFYGIFSWQIKKSRDNYKMKKGNPDHIHLDLEDGNPISGVLNWGSAEIRNPKNLVYSSIHNGTYKYDADFPGIFEIAGNEDGSTYYDNWIGETSYSLNSIVNHNNHIFLNTIDNNTNEPIYDKKNNSDDSPDFKNKTKCGWLNVTNTTKVKTCYINFTNICKTVINMESSSTTEDLKNYINEHFQTRFIIDYILLNNVIYNSDAFGGNAQWTTWDFGNLWSPNPYDLNSSFGYDPHGLITITANNNIIGNTKSIYGVVYRNYKNEIDERYSYLRRNNIISHDNLFAYFIQWINRIGINFFDKEFTKWNTSICYRDPKLNYNNWKVAVTSISSWSSTTNYTLNHCTSYNGEYYKSLKQNNINHIPSDNPEYWENIRYNESKQYHSGIDGNKGDYAVPVIDDVLGCVVFECINDCQGICPVSYLYNDSIYNTYGYYDSIYRLSKWIYDRISNLDVIFNYTNL